MQRRNNESENFVTLIGLSCKLNHYTNCTRTQNPRT